MKVHYNRMNGSGSLWYFVTPNLKEIPSGLDSGSGKMLKQACPELFLFRVQHDVFLLITIY